MSRQFVLMISLALLPFIIGGLAYTYMNFRPNGHL
jgi:hypothetical protein